jgi:thiol-disulfide isomerase/thioredoxin
MLWPATMSPQIDLEDETDVTLGTTPGDLNLLEPDTGSRIEHPEANTFIRDVKSDLVCLIAWVVDPCLELPAFDVPTELDETINSTDIGRIRNRVGTGSACTIPSVNFMPAVGQRRHSYFAILGNNDEVGRPRNPATRRQDQGHRQREPPGHPVKLHLAILRVHNEQVRRLTLVLLLAACSSSTATEPQTPALPEIDLATFQQLLAGLDRPAVVNVWASWCLPCRAEAPLLQAAHAEYGDRIEFIGLDYNDSQRGARLFLDEFDLPFTHYFDQPGEVIADLGGIGVPRTYFFGSDGELVKTHNGVIDEQTLALQIDELLNR